MPSHSMTSPKTTIDGTTIMNTVLVVIGVTVIPIVPTAMIATKIPHVVARLNSITTGNAPPGQNPVPQPSQP